VKDQKEGGVYIPAADLSDEENKILIAKAGEIYKTVGYGS